MAPSEDGHVYVIEGATGCVNKIDLGERVLSMVLADDVKGDGTLDLIVGTMTGEVRRQGVPKAVQLTEFRWYCFADYVADRYLK